MKSMRIFFALAVFINAIVGVSSARADEAADQTFLYGVYAGCMHELDTDPRTTSAPQDRKKILCTCEANYLKTNKITTQEQMEAVQQDMGNAVGACIASAAK